jgi:hypothetical protein
MQFVHCLLRLSAPKGIIFFDDESELLSGDAQYSVNYFDELGVDFQGHYITFKVDFFKNQALQPFASVRRFL